MPESPYPMIPIQEALALIEQHTHTLHPQTRAFNEALNHVLAEDVYAQDALPPFAASAMDGYAIRVDDGNPRQIKGDQTAGYVAEVEVSPGTAVYITTGAPVPSGADTVVMVEHTQVKNGELTINPVPKRGDNIRPEGIDISIGQQVLSAGTVLGPAEIGVLATVGCTSVKVYPQVRIGVMSTGDEIANPDETPGPGQIRDANRYSLMSVIRQSGAIPIDLGIVRDREGELEATIERGLAEADMLITSGGVSMGRLDLVKPYLAAHGQLHFGRVNTKPGKPVTFGTLAGKPFFGLPGNPVSALVCFEVFVRPAVLKMAGHAHTERPKRTVRLTHTAPHSPGRTEFQRAVITRAADGTLLASNTGSQSSARLLSMLGANGLLILPHGQGDYEAGSEVEALIVGVIE